MRRALTHSHFLGSCANLQQRSCTQQRILSDVLIHICCTSSVGCLDGVNVDPACPFSWPHSARSQVTLNGTLCSGPTHAPQMHAGLAAPRNSTSAVSRAWALQRGDTGALTDNMECYGNSDCLSFVCSSAAGAVDHGAQVTQPAAHTSQVVLVQPLRQCRSAGSVFLQDLVSMRQPSSLALAAAASALMCCGPNY